MNAKDLFKKDMEQIIKSAMVGKGITTKDLSTKTGYSYEGTRQIIKGNGSYWGVFKVCRALKIEMEEVLVPADDITESSQPMPV